MVKSSHLIPLVLVACSHGFLLGCSDDPASPSSSGGDSEIVTPGAPGERHLNSIGVQLYTLRTAMEQDFEGTLQAVADMGYDEVEFAGLFERDPVAVRQLLTDLNLTAPASHVFWTRWRDEPDAIIEETLALGSQYLVFPWLPDTERQTLAQWRDWVALINQVGQAARDRGLQLAYHNHDFEFAAVEGTRPYDLLLDELDLDLVSFELDLYWVAKGGGDPNMLFDRLPGGFPLVHVKDMRRSDQAIVDVGAGDLDFAAIFAQFMRSGMQHFFVEHDQPVDPMQTAQVSISYLEQLGF